MDGTARPPSRRDEWSEDGVMTLLEAYESKWTLRNRAKLKGSDWDDIAQHVSSPKTPNQCKNKIESMKKRFRSEPASSTWQFYARMSTLLKANDSKVEDGDGSINRAKPERKTKRRRRDEGSAAVAESIRLLASSLVKVEEARMEMYKDVERLRAEMDVRRSEMELRRTEIVAETQLAIARLFLRMASEREEEEDENQQMD